MSGRSYLSIGDVLSLLREEFPDVTISKIRFLESQGLVDPERSPSGYRKFYDADVERLRWVLRQQREHFLPLKVIRDRLAAAGNGVPSDEPYEDAASHEELGDDTGLEWDETAEGTRGSEVAEPVAAGMRIGAGRERGAVAGRKRSNGLGGEWPRPVRPDESGDDGDADQGTRGRAEESNVVQLAAERGTEATAVRATPAHPSSGPGESGAGAAGSSAGSSFPPSPPATAPAIPDGSARGGPARTTGQPVVEREPALHVADADHAAADVLSPSVSGVSLTVEELCAATGLAPAELASLEGFGLVRPMTVAGAAFYDEEALMVAKLVVEFGRYGVEPRHLRLFRNAVDREMGLVEQVITPLLRQRNPEARQRAMESAAELVRLGQGLSASLVRSDLRRQLGG